MNNLDRIEEEMTDAGKTQPRHAKGGVFAPTDVNIIRRALLFYMTEQGEALQEGEDRQIANLLHRLNNRI